MLLCGYCGIPVGQVAPGPSWIQLVAENAEPLGKLAESVIKSVGEFLIKPEERKFQNRTAISAAVLCLIGIAIVLTYFLADDGLIDGGTFAFSIGIVLGALVTLIGDLLLYE